jgi:hypothetical protein
MTTAESAPRRPNMSTLLSTFDSFVSRRYYPLLAALSIYSFCFSHHCSIAKASCIDRYWLDHWLITYGAGFTRRGLLGSIHYMLAGEKLNVIALNFLCFLLIALVFTLIYKCLVLLAGKYFGQRIMLLMVASPILSVFFETLGDPMHINLSIFGLSLLVCCKLDSKYLKSAVAIFAVIVTSLIHEASLFLLAPAYLLLVVLHFKKVPSIKHAFLLYACIISIALIAFASLLLSGALPPHGRSEVDGAIQSFNFINRSTYYYSGKQSIGFSELLRGEYQLYFGSVKSVVMFLIKPFRSGLVPLVFLWSAANLCSQRCHAALVIKSWFFISICSFPLYVIAHDWGRFAIYNLLVCLLIACAVSLEGLAMSEPSFSLACASRIPSLIDFKIVLPLILVYASYPITTYYRVDGIPFSGFKSIVGGLLGFTMVNSAFKWDHFGYSLRRPRG